MTASADQKIARAAKKAPLALIPFIWLWGIARVLAYGAKKYAKGNHYAATLDDGAGERYVSAAMRHCGAMQLPDGTFSPESLAARDDESGLPHIDHALCSLGILRGIMVKCGALPADPGEGKEPPKLAGQGPFKPHDPRHVFGFDEPVQVSRGWFVDPTQPPGDRCIDIETHRIVDVETGRLTHKRPKLTSAIAAPIPKGPLTWEKIEQHYTSSDRPIPPVGYKAPEDRAELDADALAALGDEKPTEPHCWPDGTRRR